MKPLSLSIQGRRPGGRWSTIDAQRQSNPAMTGEEETELRRITGEKLQQWQIHAGDNDGAFLNWQFRIHEERAR